MENGRLVSDGGRASRLQLPYVLPEEYSFTLEFIQRSGSDGVHQMLCHGGSPLVCRVAKGESGRVRTSTVEVRKDRVTVHVDNQKVLDWKADIGDWRLRQEGLPGLGTSGSPTEFRKIRLFQVAGKGRPLRPRGN